MNELTIRLRGGDRCPVRLMDEDDAEVVLAAFGQLSPTSLRQRFFTPTPVLPRAVADDLTRLDPGRIVLLAFDPTGETVIGEARAVRRRADPSTAEVALTVAEHLRRRGLGRGLLRHLRREARRAGMDRLAGNVLVDNVAAQGLLVASGAECWLDEPGVLGFELALGRRTVSPATIQRRALGVAS